MRPLFNVPGEGAFPLIMGIISRLSSWRKDCDQFQKKWYLHKRGSREACYFYK